MRIVLKISGESLKNEDLLSNDMLDKVFNDIKTLKEDNHQIILILGGGNFWRGRINLNISNPISDRIGMLATVMNGLALNDYLNKNQIASSHYSAFDICGMVEKYNYDRVEDDLKNDKVVIFSGGLGVPNFSTDMNTVEKAIEFNADMILMSKNIDAIYDKDPKEKDAQPLKVISHEELLNNQIKFGINKQGVMDIEAMIALGKAKIPLYLYGTKSNFNLKDIENNETGTKVISS